MLKPKISVVIPTYNRESKILKSINSVLNQTYKNIEVLVIDDNSTDNTKDVVKSIKDKRLKYIKLPKNMGSCYARNIGIKKAKGKYITFQDSDDVYDSKKIEKQYLNLKNNKSDMDFCKVKIIKKDNSIIFPNDEQIKSINENKILDELCNGNFISTQAIFVKRKIIKKYMFDEDLQRLQDFDLVLRMIPNINCSFTDEVLVNLYNQKDSISNDYNKLKQSIDIISNKNYLLDETQTNNLFELLKKYEKEYEEHLNVSVEVRNEMLRKELKLCKKDLYNIVNSKTWRLKLKINKFLRR